MGMSMDCQKKLQVILVAMVFLGLSCPAFAYVGPGLAGGVAVAILGLVAALLMLVVGVIWYPIKKLFKYFFARPSHQVEK